MKEVSVTELRQNLQAFLARVERGQRLRITSRGRIVAEITPPAADPEQSTALRRRLLGSVIRYEGATDPTFESDEWEMNR